MSWPPKLHQAWRERFEPLATHTHAVWRRRTPREQALLRGGAWLLAAVLLWTIGLRPALHTVQDARRQLPALLAQTSELDAIILEAQTLGRGRSGTMSTGETEEALQASLGKAGLAAVSVLSRPDSAVSGQTRWQVQFTNAPAGRVLEWMARLPFVAQLRTHQLDLVRGTVDGRDRPGQLSGFIVLILTSEAAS